MSKIFMKKDQHKSKTFVLVLNQRTVKVSLYHPIVRQFEDVLFIFSCCGNSAYLELSLSHFISGPDHKQTSFKWKVILLLLNYNTILIIVKHVFYYGKSVICGNQIATAIGISGFDRKKNTFVVILRIIACFTGREDEQGAG